MIRRLLPAVLALAACGGSGTNVTCPGEGDFEYADVLVEAPGEVTSPSAVNERENAVNGVVEGSAKSGSLDVFSRGISVEPPNNFVVVEWANRRVVDVPGPDIVVFENPFETQGGVFMDPAVVEVSLDGERWVAFPHDYLAEDESRYSRSPADWQGFAGVTPVRWQSVDCTDPFSESAGGDRFDLAALDDPELRDGFRFLRITTAATQTNPDTQRPFPRDVLSDGFDLDGVFARATEME